MSEDQVVPRGWFADIDHDDEDDPPQHGQWQAFLQTNVGCFPLDGIYFSTFEDCVAFIRRDILGKDLL